MASSEIMDKRIRDTLLLDTYGALLTDKQRAACEMKWFRDCSLSEIAKELEVSRQGVQDLITRSRENLENYEEKLSLVKQQDKLEELKKLFEKHKQNMPEEIYGAFSKLFEE